MYGTLDELIIRAIKASHGNPMYQRDVAAEGLRLGSARGRDSMRVIDGRLQSLRKAGRIVYLNKRDAPGGKQGWYLPPTTGNDGAGHGGAE